MAQEQTHLQCPVCQDVELKPIQTNRGVMVQRCPQCKGIWLEKNHIFLFTDNPQELLEEIQKAPNKPSLRRHPVSGVQLTSYSIYDNTLTIEYDDQSGGLWLDGGELTHIIVKGKESALKNFHKENSLSTEPKEAEAQDNQGNTYKILPRESLRFDNYEKDLPEKVPGEDIIVSNLDKLPGYEIIKHLGFFQTQKLIALPKGDPLFPNRTWEEDRIQSMEQCLEEKKAECLQDLKSKAMENGANAIFGLTMQTSGNLMGVLEVSLCGTGLLIAPYPSVYEPNAHLHLLKDIRTLLNMPFFETHDSANAPESN